MGSSQSSRPNGRTPGNAQFPQRVASDAQSAQILRDAAREQQASGGAGGGAGADDANANAKQERLKQAPTLKQLLRHVSVSRNGGIISFKLEANKDVSDVSVKAVALPDEATMQANMGKKQSVGSFAHVKAVWQNGSVHGATPARSCGSKPRGRWYSRDLDCNRSNLSR